MALRRAEGEPDLERMSTGSETTGSTMSTSMTDRPATPSRQFNAQNKDYMNFIESIDDNTVFNTGYNQNVSTRFEEKQPEIKGTHQYPPRTQLKSSDQMHRASYPPSDYTMRTEQTGTPI